MTKKDFDKQRFNFYDEISRNKRSSFFLMIMIFAVFVLLGYVIARIYEGYFFIIFIVAIIFSLGYIFFTYYNSHKIAVASVRAKKASRSEYRDFYNIVEGLTIASGMPMPELYIMPSNQINAFASGRSPKNSVICVTSGALEKLNRRELEGVLAHELSHIANFDIRYMTIATVMVGMIAIISELFLRSLWFSSGSGDSDSKNQWIFILIGIVLAILAPIIVKLVQLAISRKREYAADSTAVKFTRYPRGLADALKKIQKDYSQTPSQDKRNINKAIAPLFIANPFKNLGSTHPPIEKRIQILERM
ncbi:M48 family metallopeptidase [Candidatus Pacearchaeota archaeon]|nr:M48 family metallopeptidase [Candidatus Pacearchaeota archaeon]